MAFPGFPRGFKVTTPIVVGAVAVVLTAMVSVVILLLNHEDQQVYRVLSLIGTGVMNVLVLVGVGARVARAQESTEVAARQAATTAQTAATTAVATHDAVTNGQMKSKITEGVAAYFAANPLPTPGTTQKGQDS